ncbi:hypothetical protein [Riemerella anatipestifer]|uniref:hypothetical protein n=1 Tax=Riemerella anatipestifer TaxID=34085 RepID=UPI00129EB697|nr:hypothetical protein [Riemerella anatipestifer]MBT0551175.1 hypothetical protein [Riemerella anatipestifer]MBT0552970.1 hypothetical protein [Riemerella anatipestifer]MCE3025261.1 hypothetical protein [Riemerella anatipestifer]MCU7542532.1 hypothetical protein [Riemerella anatipestifer]MCU7558708.1 hypothetical protein [Riemerella anatipestifer]
MKKLILVVSILTTGIISATEIKNGGSLQMSSQEIEKFAENRIDPPKIENGFAFADTSHSGTCMTYGTWIHGDNGVSLFIEADRATLFTMGLPSCTGEGSYLV